MKVGRSVIDLSLTPSDVNVSFAPSTLKVEGFELIDLVLQLGYLSFDSVFLGQQPLHFFLQLQTSLPHKKYQILNHLKQSCGDGDDHFYCLSIKPKYFCWLRIECNARGHPDRIELRSINKAGLDNKVQDVQQFQRWASIREGHSQKFGRVELILPANGEKRVKMTVKIDIDTDSPRYKHWKAEMEWMKAQAEIADLILFPLNLKHLTCLVCTASNKAETLEIAYHKINHSLSEVIRHRQSIGKHFSEPELWYLLYVLVKVAAFLEQQNRSVGNIHPLNVMINQDSRIQLFTTFSSPVQLSNMAKVKLSHHHDVYLAPQQSRLVNEDSLLCKKNIDQNKADTFDIGLVLLSAVLLKDCYHLYSRSLFELNQEKLFHYQAQMRKMCQRIFYRQNLICLVEQFLRIDPLKRKTPQFYFRRLKRYEKVILQLQDFHYESEIHEDTVFPQLQSQQRMEWQAKKDKKYLSLLKTKPKKEQQSQEQEGYGKQQTDFVSKRLFK